MPTTIFMIALGPNAAPSLTSVQEFFARQWPDQPVIESGSTEGGVFSLRVGKMLTLVATMPVPIPWGDLEGPCATSWMWKDAVAALRQHTSHLILTVSGEAAPLERMQLLTHVTAAVLATCPQAIGVYVGDSGLVVQAPVFLQFATSPEVGLPLYIWIDFRAGTLPNGKTFGFTTGLEQLGHREFVIPAANENFGAIRERLFALSSYVLAKGPVIQHGHTVGETADQKIRVALATSPFGHKNPVLRLDYASSNPVREPAAKKPWWKPFS